MEVKINVVSLFSLILAFTFQSQHTVGQTVENGNQSDIFPEANPSNKSELARNPREANVPDPPSRNTDKEGEDSSAPENDDDAPEESLEKENSDDADGSSSSSSSSSEESSTFASTNISTTSKPASNRSLAATTRKIKLTKPIKTKLVKPRHVRKKDNWYATKRNANTSTTTTSTQKPIQKQLATKIRNVDSAGDVKELNKNLNGTFVLGHNKSMETPVHIRHSEPHRPLQARKFKKDTIASGSNPNGVYGGDMINKTSRQPFSVQRATRPVDPDVYSFFQFKPAYSIGFLWTQMAGLGKSMSGSMFGGMSGRALGGELGSDQGVDQDYLDPSIIFDWEFRRYDRACLYVEYKDDKAQINSTQVTEEVSRMVESQNEKLARRFLNWQFINKDDHETIALKGKGVNHPQYLTYKFLTITMEIFRDKICRNATPYATSPEVKGFAPVGAATKAEANQKYIEPKLLPKSFIDDLYRLFLTLRDITLSEGERDYASKRDEQDIYTDVLENCLKLDPIQWFSSTCADQVLSYDNPHNYACTPLLDYDFNSKEYDPILDGMWHMFTAVHAFCFHEFKKVNLRLWHKYSMIITNSFTEGMRTRWKASIAEPKFYIRLLGPDHKTHMETMNRCMFAATLRSEIPVLIPRFLSDSPINFKTKRTISRNGS